MLAALRHRTYRHLLAAQIVALLGTGLATVALGLLAFDLAGERSGVVLGTVLTIKMVAYVLLSPVITAAVARLPRRAVLVGADLLRLAAAAALPLVTATWQVYLLVLVLQAASATFTPTFQSVLPDVLPEDREYTGALSLSRLAYDLESVLSPALAGALLLVVPSTTLFLGTAAGFAGSAALVLSVVLPPRPPVTAGTSVAPFRARVLHGARLLFRTPGLRPLLALNLAVAAAGAFVVVQTVVVVRSVLGLGEGAVSWMLAVNGAGSMLAALVLPRLLGAVDDRRVMLAGAATTAVSMAAVPAVLSRVGPGGGAGPVLVGAVWFVVGLGWSAVQTPVGRLVRDRVPRADLPDALAAQFSLSHACWLVTYPVAGWLGAHNLLLGAAVLALVCAAATITARLLWPAGVGAGDRAGSRPGAMIDR